MMSRHVPRGATLPAYDLRRMARDLGLEIDPEELAGRGRSLRARDAFWHAANRAVLDAIDERDLIRLARIYGAQAAVLVSEGRHFQRLVAEAHRSDLGSIDTSSVSVIAKDCDVCARDDGRRLTTSEARGGALLPHRGCQRGHCSCLFTHAMPAARETRPLGASEEATYERVRRELRASLLEPMLSIATSARLSPQLRRTAARLLLERQERHLVDEAITGLTEDDRLAQRRAVLDAIGILDALVGLAGDERLSHEERERQGRSLLGVDAS